MWYDVITSEKLTDDSALQELIAQDKEHRIFILDGPVGCGKTRFVNGLTFEKKLRVPANLLMEAVFFEQEDFGTNKRLMNYFLAQLNLDILCLEDIDDPLYHRVAIQGLFAEIVVELSRRYPVLLTGVDLSRRCAALMDFLDGRYRYLRFTEQ